MAADLSVADAIALGWDVVKVGGGMGVMWLWNRQLLSDRTTQRNEAIDDKKKLQEQIDKLTGFLMEIHKHD